MNKNLILEWLLLDVKEEADAYYASFQKMTLEEALYELNNRKEVPLPGSLPKTSGKMIRILRQHFNDNVTRISLVLNHSFPEQFLFYRVSKLEPEIFAGFEFFSDIIPEFRFSFSKIGKNGFDRYLTLNETLLKYFHSVWPNLKKPQTRAAYFLYQGLGELFSEKSNYKRYWVMVGLDEIHSGSLDGKGKQVNWSGRKSIRPGDLVFIYRLAPRKAITNILRVKSEPYFDPKGAWDGFWVDLEKICTIPDITFTQMKDDPIISQWSTVRKNFQGTVTEPIPPIVYNRLLEKIPETVRTKYNLEPEKIGALLQGPSSGLSQYPTMPTPQFSGQFISEAQFEEEVIKPFLKRCGFKSQPQHLCHFCIGSQYHPTRVDAYVSDQQGPLTLFENKFRILKDEDLKLAVDQAKSYALQLGLSSFVVASPEGMWLYALEKNREALIEPIPANQMTSQQQEEEFKNLLLKLR